MATFQGENIAFKIVLTDDSGDVISTDDVVDIEFDLYLEYNKKVYLTYAINNTGEEREIRAATDKSGFEFELEATDSADLVPGRYIMQVKYQTTDTRFDGGTKITMQKGPLVKIMKAV